MREYGIDNFYIEILEECDYAKLSEREIYWIEQYDSYNQGYNMTKGGESNRGETNGRSLLTEEMVEDIRMAYNNHIRFKDVYEKYKDIISKRGLQKVWQFETWKHIMPEVYTEENKLWHATSAKSHTNGNKDLGINNQQRACTEEEIKKMRELREEGLSYAKIAAICNRSATVVRKYCLNQECTSTTKSGHAKQVKNLETQIIFASYSEAAVWAKCDRHDISGRINTEKTAGVVPTTGEAAHWISL